MIDIAPWLLTGLEENWRVWMVRGGRGSGKSHGIATLIVCFMRKDPIRVLCLREFQNSIDDSSKQLLEDKINALGYSSEFRITKYSITHKKTGARCIFRGMKSGNSLRSTEGIDLVWGEEAQTFSESSLRSLFPTIRKKGSRLIFTFNPEKETDPIWVRCERWKDDKRVIQSVVNWSDNPWFTAELNEERLRDLRTDPAMYAHIWEGELLRRSAALIMLDKCELGLEFEIPEPWETDDGRYYYGADFGFSADPNVLMRGWIKDGYFWVDYAAFGYGIDLTNIATLYDTVPGSRVWPILADEARPDIINLLKREGFNISGAPKGPGSVEDGITFLRSFKGIKIHRRCAEAAQEAMNYSYKVCPKTDQVLPVIVDAYNHFWDSCVAEGSLVETLSGPKKIEDVQVGDFVPTRSGWQRVNGKRLTQKSAPIMRLETENRVLLATPNHEVWTEEKGFVRMDALRYADTVLAYRGESKCPKSKLNTTEESGAFTQTPQMNLRESISGHVSVAQREWITSIGRYGKIIAGRFQKAIKSTTLMGTLITTICQILNASQQKSTPNITSETQRFSGKDSTTHVNSLISGTEVQKVSSFIGGLVKSLGRILPLSSVSASTAVINSCPKSMEATNSAQMPASLHGEEKQDLMMCKRRVPIAGLSSHRTNTPNYHFVPESVLSITDAGVSDVYDLSVENCPEFSASGILVHNCRYAVSLLVKAQGAYILDETELGELDVEDY